MPSLLNLFDEDEKKLGGIRSAPQTAMSDVLVNGPAKVAAPTAPSPVGGALSAAGQMVGGTAGSTLAGAGSGMALGASMGAVGGPVGAAVGAVLGLASGLMKSGAAKRKARAQADADHANAISGILGKASEQRSATLRDIL